MKIGYARISSPKQNLQMQLDALEQEGCRPIFHETISGVKMDRPEWRRCMDLLKDGDTLCVWAIDRIGRTARETVNVVYDLIKKNIEIRSLSQGVSSKTKEGRFAINMLCALAENEREAFLERSKEGMEAARKRGLYGGRKSKHEPRTRELIRQAHASKQFSIKEITSMYKISVTTLYTYLNEKSKK